MSYHIVTLPKFRAIGLKWEGKYSEVVPHLKNTIKQLYDRAEELEKKVNPSIQLGLSYHVIEDGFAHYGVFEVTPEQEIPEGMIEIHVPELTYVKTIHPKDGDIGQTYSDLHEWLFNSDYVPYREPGVEYYDVMPIKHEHYPSDRDPVTEGFEIYIPVVKK